MFYTNNEGETKVEVILQDEDIWLTQKAMGEVFDTTKQNIGQHIKNILEEKELSKISTVKKFFTVQKEGLREVKKN